VNDLPTRIEEVLFTQIGSRAEARDGGTRVPQSLVSRRKEEYVCIGMIPGMMGTLMPGLVKNDVVYSMGWVN
jgi:hypothetical protein